MYEIWDGMYDGLRWWWWWYWCWCWITPSRGRVSGALCVMRLSLDLGKGPGLMVDGYEDE